jgi:hypothetical protein
MSGPRLSRRAVLGGAASLLAARAWTRDMDPSSGDLAINERTALLFSAQAPLTPERGKRDARAVWCHVPPRSERSVLLYLHGNNNYVTVDAAGRSRVPDWATTDAARAGAAGKRAAGLTYALDRLDAGKRPVVLVPEAAVLATGSFWAREPAGQYADPRRLGLLVEDCADHLARLRRPGGDAYLPQDFAVRKGKSRLERVYFSGHSGAGLPLEEAARSALLLPDTGVPADLWLFDCTYWSKVDGFVEFCRRWHAAGRLGGGHRDHARFACVYRPKTQTEEVADALRGEIAKVLGVEAGSLVRDHSAANLEAEIRPALRQAGVLFLRTLTPHDEIPTLFIPDLLRTAAS